MSNSSNSTSDVGVIPSDYLSGGLSGRVCLVTGGSRGIGRSCCVHLARAGAAFIAINYNKNREAAEETQSLISKANPQCRTHLYPCDVTKVEEVNSMVHQIEADSQSSISVVVNNAGVGSVRELSEVTLEDFDLMINTNLRSAFIVTQAVYRGMEKQRWGRIIFITSIAAYTGGVTGPHYSASKAGLIGLTNSYAHRLVKFGITSNAVSPGLVETDMIQQVMDKVGKEKILAATQPGRLGHVDEVGSLVALLACNGYINGQTIGVDGGIYKK